MYAQTAACPEPAAEKVAPKPRAAAKAARIAATPRNTEAPLAAAAEPKSPAPVRSAGAKPFDAKKPASTLLDATGKRANKKPTAHRSTAKRPAAAARTEKTPRMRAAVDKSKSKPTSPTRPVVPDIADLSFPDMDATIPDVNEGHIEKATNNDADTDTRVGATTERSLLDAFDSDDFLEALREDRLFGPVPADDFNVGEDDWLFGLDSDLEGDEESILHDQKSNADHEESDAESVEDDTELPSDRVDPVTLDLAVNDLDRLQGEEWDYFDEQHSGQLQVDAAPLYDGPSGPTKAALAYAENPLAIFYFFLPKELCRRIAAETNKYRLDSVDEVAQGMRQRAREKSLTSPSTTDLSVEAYRAKLRRKNNIQPHEIVQFIGLLIARALEPRRESVTRHWITRTEGALSRGTFGQFLSRNRFQDIARYLHFNHNELQHTSGDRTFKIRPVVQALQKQNSGLIGSVPGSPSTKGWCQCVTDVAHAVASS
ncbi:unnamed protein product [Phytophthora fragariaefolia]|uniref:Unnamed protein product n=1 Tax=Phytophthora fragariaefolia TaxID=1490495 RepID=A0A9W6XTU6_9STRA|nr:unnamed protein product [Phytophthora fragariaefolia]